VPFFLVSCAQGWRAQAFAGGGEAGSHTGIPWDAAQAIRQRVAALPAAVQEILGVAAVAGREAPRAMLNTVAGRPEEEVVAALEVAYHARLLEEAGDPVGRTYRFAHDLVREVVEGALSAARRTLLHRAVARALEQAPGEPWDVASRVEALAYHYSQTEEQERAAHWLERAGDAAAAGYANATALTHYTRARERLVACGVPPETVSSVDEKLGLLHLRLGNFAPAREDFARAREGATEPARRAELWRQEGLTWAYMGDWRAALAAFDAAEAECGAPPVRPMPAGAAAEDAGREESAARPEPGALRLALALNRAEACHFLGQPDAVEAALQQARTLLQTEHLVLPTFTFNVQPDWIRMLLADGAAPTGSSADDGYQAWARGDLPRAAQAFRHQLADRERVGDQGGIVTAWYRLGIVALERAEYDQAEESLGRCLALAERIGAQNAYAMSTAKLGDLARHRGRLAQAEEHFHRFQALVEQLGDRLGIGYAWKALGDIALDRGELVQAEDHIRRGLAVLHEIRFQYGVAECWSNLGWVAAERGDLTAAAGWCRRARRLAQSSALPDVPAHALFVHVAALLRGSPSAPRLRAAALLLARGRALSSAPGWMRLSGRAALLEARLALCQATLCGEQRAWMHARSATEAARQLAQEAGLRQEEALAARLLGQCALAQDRLAEAAAHLRAALALQEAMGTALEAARTRVVLAEALSARAATGEVPAEARQLRSAAQAQFARSGAALDLAQAEQLAAAWATR
jgi:tetratricopeptide (TPR) repeat protein